MSEKERKDNLKKKLHQYQDLDNERKQIQAKYNALTDPRGANLNGMPRGPGSGDPMVGIASKRQALAEQYRAKLEELAAAQADIEALINCLEPLARQVMRYRYIDGMPWEEVCVAIRYSWRQTHNIHSDALDRILEKYE